jgi:transposase
LFALIIAAETREIRMEDLDIKRLDHHGLVMGVIKDLGIIDHINARLGVHEDEKTTVGERIAAMIINGLGFTDQPLSLVADFFEDLPLDRLFGRPIEAKDFNRFALARALDRVYEYGDSTLFAEIAAIACIAEGVDRSIQSLDTTSFSMTGEYDGETPEGCIKIVHGYSKDHRSDLRQCIIELMVSHDGDVPVHMKSWDGNAADCTIFRERSTELLKQFELGQMKCLVADSKFYTKENSKNWHLIQYITRIPENIKEAKDYIKKAVELNVWESHSNKKLFYRKFDVSHYNTKQRWIVCYSNESYQRVVKTIDKKVQREADEIKKQLKKLCSQKFSCSKDAKKIAIDMTKKWNFHAPDQIEVKLKEKIYQIEVQYRVLKEVVEKEKHEKSCFILGSNLLPTDYTDEEVITGYKNQQAVERGYRFLKDPYFFAQGFFLKKPERISALIMVMTLSLLIYSIAQRRLRKALKEQNEILPDRDKKAIKKPTLRWALHLLRGVHCVSQKIGGEMRYSLQGMSETKKKIIRLMGGGGMRIYSLEETILLQQRITQ